VRGEASAVPGVQQDPRPGGDLWGLGADPRGRQRKERDGEYEASSRPTARAQPPSARILHPSGTRFTQPCSGSS
jgi:hypothetical protein